MSKTYYKLNLGTFNQKIDNALPKLARIIIDDTKPYVPHKNGRLEKAIVRNDGRQIVYKKPYARFLWHGKLMLAPNGSSWAKRGEKKHVVNKDLKFDQSINPFAGKYWFIRSKNSNLNKWVYDLKKLIK